MEASGSRGNSCIGQCVGQAILSKHAEQDVIRATQENDVDPELLEFELQTERALRENSIDSDLLELELTESSLMTHAEKQPAFSRD